MTSFLYYLKCPIFCLKIIVVGKVKLALEVEKIYLYFRGFFTKNLSTKFIIDSRNPHLKYAKSPHTAYAPFKSLRKSLAPFWIGLIETSTNLDSTPKFVG